MLSPFAAAASAGGGFARSSMSGSCFTSPRHENGYNRVSEGFGQKYVTANMRFQVKVLGKCRVAAAALRGGMTALAGFIRVHHG